MSTPKFSIPEEFRSFLQFVDSLDTRSDNDILESLTKHVSVTSEKNIWTYWHAGVDAIPDWCQRNIANWARLCGPSWTIRVLDSVSSSPNNALEWVDASQLPETFVKGTMDGPYVGPHSADFLRGISLFNHGGFWIDVSIPLFRSLDDICWKQLEDPNSPFEVSVPVMYANAIANHFVTSRKGDPFIKRWHDLFISLWKDRSNYSGIIANPLVDLAKTLDFSELQASDYHWEFKVDPTTVFECIWQVLSWMRLSMIEEPSGFNGAEYYANKVLLFNALSEDWGAEVTIGFNSQDLFAKSSMQKITHGKNLTKGEALGVILDKESGDGLCAGYFRGAAEIWECAF